MSEIANHIPLLPEWAKIVAINLLGLYVIIGLIHLILKKLQKPEMLSAISTLKNLSGEALRRASRSLELPVERPRLALLSLVLNSALFYIFALIIFAWFGIFFMISTSTEELTFIKRLMGFGISAGLLILSRWYYVSAERQRITVLERWRSLKNDKNS